MKTKQNTKLINHVAFILDASGSMTGLVRKMREVMATQLSNLRNQEVSSNQETRISIFKFGNGIKTLFFEIDAKQSFWSDGYYSADMGGTALIDSTIDAVNALAKIPQIGGDHSFLVYVQTDGAETENTSGGPELNKLLKSLPDNWTVAVTVPNLTAKHAAKSYGFPSDNIEVWDPTEQGLEEVSAKMIASTQSYYTARSAGIKGTKSLFKMGPITKTEVKKNLAEVSPGDYETLLVRPYDDGKAIKDFVENWTKKPYRIGSAYYQVTKPEKIQAGKVVAVVEKSTGKMFSGPDARKLVGLPDYEVKIAPADFKLFDLFIQSHSTNRKLVANTQLIVFK